MQSIRGVRFGAGSLENGVTRHTEHTQMLSRHAPDLGSFRFRILSINPPAPGHKDVHREVFVSVSKAASAQWPQSLVLPLSVL